MTYQDGEAILDQLHDLLAFGVSLENAVHDRSIPVAQAAHVRPEREVLAHFGEIRPLRTGGEPAHAFHAPITV